MSVALVDSGGANIGSVRYALQRLGADADLTCDRRILEAADHVILPGVGAAAPAMAHLRALGLTDVLRNLTQPVLGVCLGMQLLCRHSEEGDVDCLGLIAAPVRKFDAASGLRIPHAGWNRVVGTHDAAPCASDAREGWAYFVHSYRVPLCAATVAVTTYGADFSAAVAHRNFLGVQFHPERSSVFGQAVLRNFLAT